MSENEGETIGELETGIIESSEENSTSFPPKLVDEKINASLEPLDTQITALTEMMDHLIQSNSAKEATTTSSRGTRHQYELPYSEVPGSSRCPTVAPLATAGYSPDIILVRICCFYIGFVLAFNVADFLMKSSLEVSCAKTSLITP